MTPRARKSLLLIKSVITGLIAAIIGTATHQVQVQDLPIGLVFALGVSLIFAIQIRKDSGRFGATLFAVVLGSLIFWIGLDFQKDKLIPADLFGYIWAYGAISLAALVAIWPTFANQKPLA